MLRYINLILLMALAIFAGCNNPSGGSSIARDHTPLLQPPGNFDFTQIRAQNGNVSLKWSSSARVSSYEVRQGTSPTTMNTVLPCSTTLNYCNLTGQNPATLYYYTIVATNAAGTKTVANTGTSLAVGSFDITASTPSNGAIDLTWSAATGATSYNILYGTRSGSYTSSVNGVTSPYTLSGLTNNRGYFVRVVAVNANNGYGLSNSEANDTPYGPPPTPASVLASAAPGQITLTWGTSVGATSYNIYKGTVSGSLTQIVTGQTTTTYVDSAVSDGTEYFYAVEAVTGIYTSALSAETSAKPISNFAMTSASSGPGTNQVTVVWPATTGADSYDIKYGTNPASLNLTATNVTSPYVLSGLTGSVTYYFRIRAVNTAGTGTTLLSTNQLNAIPIPLLPAPTGFTASATPGQVVLNWNAVSGASSYEILRGTVSGTLTSLATGINATTYTDSTVTNGTTYYYAVRAFNGMNGASSAEVSIKPIATFTISSITAVSGSSLQVTWGAGAGADFYDVQYGTTSGSYTTTVANVTSPYSITGLAANTTYYVVVRGRNTVGSGTALVSAQSSGKTKTAAPTGLVAVSSSGSVALDWANTAGATTYNVYRGTVSGTLTSLATGIAVSNYTDSTVTDGTTYYYAVTADNGSESAQSTEVATRSIASFSLTSVTAPSPTSLTVTWPAATGAASYDIKYGTATGSYTTTLANKTSPFTITGLAGNTTYYVMVVAKNAVGTGSSSNSNELSQTTPVGPPTGMLATVGSGQITISWTAMSGASSYKIFRSTTSGTYGAALATGVVTTNYVDTTVTDGTQYYYVVKSFNGADSADSTEVTGETITPFSLTSVVAASTTSIQVTFPATTGATVYDVKYGTTSGTYSTTVSSVTSPYTITGLSSNTTYYVVARARNTIGGGASQTTAELSVKTPVGAPTGLVAVSSPGSVALDWANTSGATTYNVYRGTTSGSTTLLASGVAVSNYTDNTAANGTTYYYAVTADNGSESAKSSEVSTQPIASHTIASLTSPSSTSIQVTWGAVTGAASYDVLWGTTSGSYTGSALNKTSPYTITALSANTTYYVVVKAKNAVGAGTTLNSTESSIKTATSAPTGLVASASSGQVGLNWTATTGATTYNVYRGTTSGSLTQLASGVATNAYLDTTVANGTTYYYTVSADNGSESAQSAEVAVRPISSFSISSLNATSNTTIDVTWGAATGAATYDVRYGTSTGVYLGTVTNVTSPYTLTGLSADTTYFIVVRANNAVGAGTSIQTSEMSEMTATAAPSGLVATSSASGNASLSWNAATGATNYNIYRGTVSGTHSVLASGVSGTTYTDTTVTDGTTYFYTVRSYNGTESPDSNESSTRSISDFTISSTSAPSPNSIIVNWSAVTGAATYDVKYGTTSGSYTTTVTGVTSPYTITGLASGTQYYIVVKAKNAIGGTAMNQSAEAQQITPIGPPSGLTASATPGSVALSWTAAGGASSYKVYRSTTSGSYGAALATGITGTTYTDNTAANGTTYFYTVTSFNGADSAYATEVSVKPIANVTISSVTSPSSTSLQVTWAAATGAATYDVRYGTSTGSYTTTVTSVSSPYTITGLSANTTYYVVVRANNSVGAGTSVTSSESSKKTMTGAPTGLVASASPGSVGLNWTAVTGASTYSVYRSTSTGTETLLSSGVATNAYTDTTVSNGTTYFYTVTADNGTESAQSSEVSIRPISSFSISSLTGASSTSISITWGAATGAASYDVRYGTSSGSLLFTVSNVTSPYTLTGLSANTQYFVSVRAKNAVGSGTQYDASEMNVYTATAAPTSLAAAASTGHIDLSWVAAAGATNYRIYRGTSSGSYSQIAAGVTGTTYSDTTVTDGTQYYYSVRGYNGTESPDSNEATAKSIAAFSITSTTAPTSSTIQVTWPATAGAASYDVRYGTTSGSYTTVASVSSPYTITGLTGNTTYYIVVRANNAIGSGSSAQTAEVTQNTPTAAPTGLASTATPGSVSLSWTATTGATSYNIYRSTTSGSYGAALATGVATNSYTDATVSNGTTYFYTVTAVNGAESAKSNETTIKPIASFTITSATASSPTQIDVTWPAVTGAASYDVKYGTTTGTYTTTLTNQTSPVALTGLAPGSTYYIVVIAKNAVGSGTAYQSAEVSSQTAFGPPGGMAVTATPGQAVVTWSSVSGASSYKIFRSTTSGSYGAALATGLTSPTYTDTTVANGTTYYYIVHSVNSGGSDSADSSEVSVRPISSFTLSSATPTSSSTIDIAWTAATGAASYDVKYGTSTGSYSTTLTNQTSPLTITGLSANTTYYIIVQAKNAVGTGTTVNSSELSAKTATAAPSSLTATATTGQIALSWSAPAGATNYNIYRSTTSGSYGAALATAVAGTTYTDTTVSNGTQYYYIVKANNGILSAASSEVTGQSIAAFSITSTTAPTTSTIQVTWPATSGATSYDVRYGTSTGSYSTTVSAVSSPYTITGLTSATTYYIVVRANNGIGSGSSATTAEVTQVTPLGAPSGLTATSTPGSVALSWGAVSGASSYKVYRSTTSGSYGAALATGVGTNSYTDNTVTNGTQYFYVVKAYNGADSADSNEATTKPIASFSITSTTSPSSSSVQVTWTGPAGGATYDVKYGTATGSYSTTVANQTSPYTITGLSANTTYYIVIVAKNAIGSGTSVTSSESTQKTASAAPTGLAAVASPASVALTWTAVTGATDYKVYRSTTSGSYGAALATGVATASYTDNTVSNGTTYFYTVVANNGSDSAMSSEVSVRPISSFTFSTLTVASATSLDLTWTAATGAASYDVQYGTTTGTYGSSATNVTSPYTLTGLTANTTYYVRVQAKNAVGAGTTINSSELNAKTATAAPSGLTATATTSQIALSWTGSTGATAYKIYRGTSTGSYALLASPAGTGTTYTDSTASNGTTYFYAVTATNGTESAYSNEATGQPIASFALTSVVAASTTSLTVTWPATSGATSYDVRYGNSSGSYTTTVTGQTSPYTITGLTSGSTYYVVVRATNAVGSGASVQTAELSAATPLGPPTGLTATTSVGSIQLNWTAVTGATSYKVFRSTTSGSYGAALATGIGGTSYTDNTVSNGTTYYYVVKTYNGSDSAASSEVSGQPIANFTISLTGVSATDIQVSWTAPSGGATYDIKYGTATGSYGTTLTNKTSPFTISSLSSNTTYYVVVVAKNAVGSGTSTQSSESNLKTATGAPTGLAASASLASVGLTWTAVTGATSYKVYRSTTSGSYGAALATGVGTNSYTDNTVSNGTIYFYTVVANNGADSAMSSEVTVRPISSFSLTAATAASATSIDLTWGTATGATTYDVRYGTSTGVYLWSATGVTSPYTLTGLTSGTRYYISIRASNATGAGTTYDSNEMNALTAVGAPTGVAAAATPGQAVISWTAVAGATNYNVYRATTSGGAYTQVASAVAGTSYTNTGLTNGTTYYYVVRAYNGIESANSTEVAVQPIANFTLSAATVNSSSQITLTWAAATGATAYDVKYGTSSGSYSTTVSGVTSSYAVTGLSAATLYYFVVTAKNAVGAGTTLNSNEVSGRTSTAAPSSLTATSTNGNVALSWTAASGATNYNIYRGTSSGVYSQIASAIATSTYNDNTITNGTTYYYVVRAYNGTESGNSNEAAIATIGSFTISATTATNNSIQVTWGAGTNATAYDVRYGTTSGTYSTTVTGVTSPYTITGLTSNTTYYISVRGRNAGSTTIFNSAEASQITALAAPTGLAATGGTSQVSLSWTAVSGATSYKVYRGTVSGSLTSLATGIVATTYSDTTAVNGTTYYYAVLAYNGTDSALSSEVSKQPIAVPSISSVTGDSSSSILVTWGATTGAATYNVQYGTVSGTYTTTFTSVTSPYQIPGLTPGTTYYVRVQAVNAVGGGTTINSSQSSGTPNSPPVMSAVANPQTMEADTALPVNFTLSDSNNVLTCTGSMSASSSNTTLLPNANIVFSGTLPNCVATITPAATQTGTTTITLSANDGISTTSQTFDLNVTPCVVASIAWVTQPTGMAAGANFGTAPKLSLLKADSSLCMSNTAPVELIVTTDTTEQQDATITGTASVTPSGGYANFTAASMQRAGTGFTIAAVQNGVTSPNSNTFNVTAGSASKLVYYQQPLTNDPSTAMIPAPSVRSADQYGNYVSVSGISVTMSLQDNTEGATLSGTLTASTNASGIASFANLSINTLGNYYLRATPGNGWSAADSDYFDIIVITPQNFTTVVDMISSTIFGSNGNATWPRSGTTLGTNYADGLNTCTWKIVAYNDSNSTGTVSLLNGSTSVATISVNKNLGAVPTVLSTTFNCATYFTASGNWNLSTFKGLTLMSSQIILKQVSAKRTQVYLPLLSISETDATGGVTTTSTTPVAVAAQNNATYDWDSSEWGNLNEVVFIISGKASSGSFCGALFNKTSNTQIGGEICSTSTADTVVTQSIPRNLMPSTGELEARVRNTAGGTTTVYKTGVLLRLVNIQKAKSIQRIAGAKTLTASTDFVSYRDQSFLSGFSTAVTKNERLICRAKSTSGSVSGSITMKNATTNTSGTTNSGTVTGSTISYSNTASYSNIENTIGPTTNGNYYYLNYAHTSGSLDLSQCLYSVDALY